MFTKQHYEYLSDWLANASLALHSDLDRRLVAHSLCDWLYRLDPNFNPTKFLARAKATPMAMSDWTKS